MKEKTKFERQKIRQVAQQHRCPERRDSRRKDCVAVRERCYERKNNEDAGHATLGTLEPLLGSQRSEPVAAECIPLMKVRPSEEVSGQSFFIIDVLEGLWACHAEACEPCSGMRKWHYKSSRTSSIHSLMVDCRGSVISVFGK